jgi:hypothetical protein
MEENKGPRTKLEKNLAFDPDLPPNSEHNRNVAQQRGVGHDSRKLAYLDQDGCPRYDSYGQPL